MTEETSAHEEVAWTIRHPTPADADGLALVHVTGWREAYGDLLPEHFYGTQAMVQRRALWSRGTALPEYVARTLVAELDGEIVGFALRTPTRDEDSPVPEELAAIYVLSEVYGTGIGQALLDGALDGRPAMLWVAKDNPRARRFYEKNGFHPDGEEKSDPDLKGLVEIRMVRR
ncbi:GNAT family N-acetyltransferase [Brevibacterium sp. 50QC2O2]|uniref:GNAT family N-acetyltransferase n=1 Tax=Brevibacterium TaxID=1696 RepID=UPI00211D0839|nr:MULTISPECIES: GNAT family N-acetyltransferase [unclassified Brevibacterium]MCQ9366755.1 GNAT family N-acetyltransferase [Brevibacterium sp. 91QC2O2]MCQ9384273.1 GNAT family N-acetyltransferase [Brevibacterium sp. 68QC2CO]MCQ9388892.1 GNAT family N-acetyltransferase [Brevibacterium sp. 50QC2O2]